MNNAFLFAVRTGYVLLGLALAAPLYADTKTEGISVGSTRIALGLGDYDNFYDLGFVELPQLISWTDEPAAGRSSFPLDSGVVPDPWTFKTREDEFGYWLYANENGRVRTRVRTGNAIGQSSAVELTLMWQASFVRDSNELPSFTLNPSRLVVRARQYSRGPQRLFDPGDFPYDPSGFLTKDDLETLRPVILSQPSPPYAEMEFFVVIFSSAPGFKGRGGSEFVMHSSDVFKHSSRVSGIAYEQEENGGHPLQLEYANTSGWYDRNFDWRSSPEQHPVGENQIATYLSEPYCIDLFQVSGFSAECQQELYDGFHYEIGPYTGRIDLDALGLEAGDEYIIMYVMRISAGEDQAEQFAEAILADPLDNDAGGLSLETTDSSVASSHQICGEAPDPQRFIVNADGTATDGRTGLMWQRCPLGMNLDDRGTSDPDDDVCSASTDPMSDWQSALQVAGADASAGYVDWRLPDVKELESLVLPGCALPAADRLAFPDTPPAVFWSSTPLRLDPIAWQVDFFDGDVRWVPTDRSGYARLVRDSGEAPNQLRPTIEIDEARAEEPGENGSAQLVFPVRLSRSLDEAVTVNWETVAETAIDGVDFVGASGELTIPAGALIGYINIEVKDDREPESKEMLYVQLTDVSSHAHLAIASAFGVIEDDEPRVRTSRAEWLEGDTGTSQLRLKLHLDRIAQSTLSLEYATQNGSAIAGVDYAAVSGTVLIASGDQDAEVLVPINGDATLENDEWFEIVLSSAEGLHIAEPRITATIVDDDGPGTYAALNDTGITHCATGDNGYLPCPQTGLSFQDGEIGRDITDANPDDGHLGFSFVKMDASGSDLDPSATSWSCVRDEVSGLVWENKSFDISSPNYTDWTYSWRNDSGINDGGDPGVAAGGECLIAGTCDTQQFVDEMNATALCGFTDWRLPTVDEMYSLADFNSAGGSTNIDGVDGGYFRPNPRGANGAAFWTATPAAGNPASAWMIQISMFGARAKDYDKSTPTFLRLVRGGLR